MFYVNININYVAVEYFYYTVCLSAVQIGPKSMVILQCFFFLNQELASCIIIFKPNTHTNTHTHTHTHTYISYCFSYTVFILSYENIKKKYIWIELYARNYKTSKKQCQ